MPKGKLGAEQIISRYQGMREDRIEYRPATPEKGRRIFVLSRSGNYFQFCADFSWWMEEGKLQRARLKCGGENFLGWK